MILKIEKIFSYLFVLIPLFLITGPAIPDIVITMGVLFGIYYTIFLKKYKKLLEINFVKISFLFWISLILICFFSYNKINSFQDSIIFIRFLLIPIFIFFIYFEDNKILNHAILLIFALVIFVCVDTFFQFLNYSSEHGFGRDILGFKSNWYGRLTGPFGDELIPGSYVSKFGLVGYVFLISHKRFKKNFIIQSFYLSSILLICFVSGERMAFATFFLGLFFLLIFLNGFRKYIFSSILLGSILIFVTVYLHPFYNDYKIIDSKQYHQGLKLEKFYKCNNEEEICSKVINVQPSFFEIMTNFKTSAYGEIYLLSYRMFLDNPITGIGVNNFKDLCNSEENYKNLMVNYECASHPHNIYIQWLAEGGLIVFFSFIFYLIYLINLIIKNNGDRKYKIISLIIILTMFWPIMSTGSLVKNWFGVTTFFLIGICISVSKLKNNYKI